MLSADSGSSYLFMRQKFIRKGRLFTRVSSSTKMERRVPDIYGNQPTRDSGPLKHAGDSSGKEWLCNQGTLYVKRRMTECAVMSCVLLNVERADDEVNNRFERHNVRSPHLPDLFLIRAPLHHAAKLANTTGRTYLAATFPFRIPFIEVDETPFYSVIPARSVHYKAAATTQATIKLTPGSYVL